MFALVYRVGLVSKRKEKNYVFQKYIQWCSLVIRTLIVIINSTLRLTKIPIKNHAAIFLLKVYRIQYFFKLNMFVLFQF